MCGDCAFSAVSKTRGRGLSVFKECRFRVRVKVRIRVRLRVNPNPKRAFFFKKVDPGPDPAFYRHHAFSAIFLGSVVMLVYSYVAGEGVELTVHKESVVVEKKWN